MVARLSPRTFFSRTWTVGPVATTLALASLVGSGCGEGDDGSASTTSRGSATVPSTSSASTTSPYPSSPTDVATAWREMDGLFAPSILQAPTVGLDPFAIRGDPADLFAEVDVERLMGDVHALSDPRGEDDPDGLAAAAALVEDGFRDAGYRVRRFPEQGAGDKQATTSEPGETTTTGEDARPATTATSGADGADTPAITVSVPGEECSDRELVIVAPYDAPSGSPGARA